MNTSDGTRSPINLPIVTYTRNNIIRAFKINLGILKISFNGVQTVVRLFHGVASINGLKNIA